MSNNGFAKYQQENPRGFLYLDFEVRSAGSEDAHAVLAVNRAAGRPTGTADAVAASIANSTRHTVIATSAGEAIGWATTHYWDYTDEPAPAGHYLGGITVHPDWRRRGVGTALTAARIDWIFSRAAEVWYIVNIRNRASIELHHKWGFEEIARAPGFHTTTFTGGIGLLMRALPPER